MENFKPLNPFVKGLGTTIYYKRFNYTCSDKQKQQYYRMFRLHNSANFVKGDYSNTSYAKTTLKNYNTIQQALNYYYNTFPDLWNFEVEQLVRFTLEYYEYRLRTLHKRGSIKDIVLALILIYNRKVPAGFYRRRECRINKKFVDRVKINLDKTYKPLLTRVPYDLRADNNQILDTDTYVTVEDY